MLVYNRGPRVDFQSEGGQNCAFFSIFRRHLCGGRRRGNFVFGFSRTQENAFLDAFLKNFVFMPQMFLCAAQKWKGMGPDTVYILPM